MRVLEVPLVVTITGTVPKPLSVITLDDTDAAVEALITLVKSNALGVSSTLPLPVMDTPLMVNVFNATLVPLTGPVVLMPGATRRPTVSKYAVPLVPPVVKLMVPPLPATMLALVETMRSVAVLPPTPAQVLPSQRSSAPALVRRAPNAAALQVVANPGRTAPPVVVLASKDIWA